MGRRGLRGYRTGPEQARLNVVPGVGIQEATQATTPGCGDRNRAKRDRPDLLVCWGWTSDPTFLQSHLGSTVIEDPPDHRDVRVAHCAWWHQQELAPPRRQDGRARGVFASVREFRHAEHAVLLIELDHVDIEQRVEVFVRDVERTVR